MRVPESTKRRLVLANRRSQPAPAEDGDEVVAAAEDGDRYARTLEAEDLCRDDRVALGRTARREARRVDVDERGRVALEHALGKKNVLDVDVIKAALAKAEAEKAPAGKTFGEVIKEGKMPASK